MQRAEVFEGNSILDAWRRVGTRLTQGSPPYVVVVTVGTAWQPTAQDLHKLDRVASAAGAERPTAVAEMLLPKVVHLSTENPNSAVEGGLKLLGRGRKRGLRFSTWTHTYFERIVGVWYDRFGERTEIKANRLVSTIEKMKKWEKNAEAVFYIHTDLSSDSFRPRGSPCLQYVQFRAYGDGKLALVGLYRAHDYTNKFLGNAIGLQRLGEFVARHTNRTFEGLTVVSLHPFCQSKRQIRQFIDNVGV